MRSNSVNRNTSFINSFSSPVRVHSPSFAYYIGNNSNSTSKPVSANTYATQNHNLNPYPNQQIINVKPIGYDSTPRGVTQT